MFSFTATIAFFVYIGLQLAERSELLKTPNLERVLLPNQIILCSFKAIKDKQYIITTREHIH